MRFLVGWSKFSDFDIDGKFGVMTGTGGVHSGIQAGLDWASDSGGFKGKEFDHESYSRWLKKHMVPFRHLCRFLVIRDSLGNAKETYDLFYKWIVHEMYDGWPLAYVAQDGQEDIDLPDPSLWSTLFIGGTSRWKDSDCAKDVIIEAQTLGKHIHIGRVNYWKRYKHFAKMPGSKDWTCDGTRYRFWGPEVTFKAWLEYMETM